jgi:sortase A
MSATKPTRRFLRLLERLFLVIGLLGIGYFGWVSVEAKLYQAQENAELDTILASRSSSIEPTAPVAMTGRRLTVAEGDTLGRLEIPRLDVSVVVRAGSDARTLRLAVGHIPGTAFPGEPGNIGLAGHRDTFFRRLRDIAADDTIRLVTPEGRFTYRVQRTDVVRPSDVWVLDATETPTLTLITCYPFTYVGTAPERFVVHAVLES